MNKKSKSLVLSIAIGVIASLFASYCMGAAQCAQETTIDVYNNTPSTLELRYKASYIAENVDVKKLDLVVDARDMQKPCLPKTNLTLGTRGNVNGAILYYDVLSGGKHVAALKLCLYGPKKITAEIIGAGENYKKPSPLVLMDYPNVSTGVLSWNILYANNDFLPPWYWLFCAEPKNKMDLVASILTPLRKWYITPDKHYCQIWTSAGCGRNDRISPNFELVISSSINPYQNVKMFPYRYLAEKKIR